MSWNLGKHTKENSDVGLYIEQKLKSNKSESDLSSQLKANMVLLSSILLDKNIENNPTALRLPVVKLPLWVSSSPSSEASSTIQDSSIKPQLARIQRSNY